MSIYEPTTHETEEGINPAWNADEPALCVCGCGKPMTPHAEGLSLECGRKMWDEEFAEAMQHGEIARSARILAYIENMERAA